MMSASVDPAEAARALDIAAGQRAALAAKAGRPWWVWVGSAVLVAAYFAAQDFLSDAAFLWIQIAFVLCVGITLSPAARRRINSWLGRRAELQRDLPLRTHIYFVTVMAVLGIGMFVVLTSDLPVPAWAASHATAFKGALCAFVFTPLAWLADVMVRRRIAAGRG